MIQIQKFDSPVGAEVLGVDLREPLTDLDYKVVRQAWAEHGVLVFRGQSLSPKQHIDFSRRFGELEVLKMYEQYLHKEHPEIFMVSNVVENGRNLGLPDAGRIWHTDVSYKAEPAMGSALYAREVPMRDGKPLGDTLFASMYAAWEALPADLQSKLAGATAAHRVDEKRYKKNVRTQEERGNRAELTHEQRSLIKDVHHPVARTHPVTERKCLYVNELFTVAIDGLEDAESDETLAFLCQHATQPKFQYRHKWAVGDLILWDNCAVQHNAVGDYLPSDRRLMHRTTIKGGPTF